MIDLSLANFVPQIDLSLAVELSAPKPDVAEGAVHAAGAKWQAGEESIAQLAKQLGISWNYLHALCTKFGYHSPAVKPGGKPAGPTSPTTAKPLGEKPAPTKSQVGAAHQAIQEAIATSQTEEEVTKKVGQAVGGLSSADVVALGKLLDPANKHFGLAHAAAVHAWKGHQADAKVAKAHQQLLEAITGAKTSSELAQAVAAAHAEHELHGHEWAKLAELLHPGGAHHGLADVAALKKWEEAKGQPKPAPTSPAPLLSPVEAAHKEVLAYLQAGAITPAAGQALWDKVKALGEDRHKVYKLLGVTDGPELKSILLGHAPVPWHLQPGAKPAAPGSAIKGVIHKESAGPKWPGPPPAPEVYAPPPADQGSVVFKQYADHEVRHGAFLTVPSSLKGKVHPLPKSFVENGQAVLKKLTPDEKTQITSYTGNGYYAVNKGMWKCPETLDCLKDNERKKALAIEGAIAKAGRLAQPITVWRKFTPPNPAEFLQFATLAAGAGEPVLIPGIKSCSTGSHAFKGQPVVLEIRAKTGLWVDPISECKGGTEQEFLQGHSTRYRVVAVKKFTIDDEGIKDVVQLEEV